jgi:hypothetical protein
MNVWEFADKSPILAFLLACIAASVICCPIKYAFRAYNRKLRSRNIAAQGWPTPPMDADGDIVEKDDK